VKNKFYEDDSNVSRASCRNGPEGFLPVCVGTQGWGGMEGEREIYVCEWVSEWVGE